MSEIGISPYIAVKYTSSDRRDSPHLMTKTLWHKSPAAHKQYEMTFEPISSQVLRNLPTNIEGPKRTLPKDKPLKTVYIPDFDIRQHTSCIDARASYLYVLYCLQPLLNTTGGIKISETRCIKLH